MSMRRRIMMRIQPVVEVDSAHARMLAEEFCAQFHAEGDEDERRRVVELLLSAAQFLAHTVGPGAWEFFDAAEFMRERGWEDPDDELFGHVTLVGYFAFLGFQGFIGLDDSALIIADIQGAGPPDPMLEELCRLTLDVLDGHP
jgi:hypothetical protein